MHDGGILIHQIHYPSTSWASVALRRRLWWWWHRTLGNLQFVSLLIQYRSPNVCNFKLAVWPPCLWPLSGNFERHPLGRPANQQTEPDTRTSHRQNQSPPSSTEHTTEHSHSNGTSLHLAPRSGLSATINRRAKPDGSNCSLFKWAVTAIWLCRAVCCLQSQNALNLLPQLLSFGFAEYAGFIVCW